MNVTVALSILFGLFVGSAPVAAEVRGGVPPSYTARTLTAVPNAAAMTAQFWSPGLNDGYVPQGLTFSGGSVYVAAYKSVSADQGRGPCRVYRMNGETGAITGQLDLPASCGHAGGMARGAAGRIWVADTRDLFEIQLAAPGAAGLGSVVRTVKLTGKVLGSFAAGSDGAIWLGGYDKEPGRQLYKFALSNPKPVWNETDALAALPVPDKAQGAAFDARGQLWLTRSGGSFGELVSADPSTGAIIARYRMPAGIEDISFDDNGQLWAVSEAGSQRWSSWETFFPVVFRLDLKRLR